MLDVAEPFGMRFSRSALEDKKALPAAFKLPFYEVADAITQDPEGIVELSDREPTREEVFVYSHPDCPLEVTFALERETRVVRFLRIKPLELEPRHVLFVSYAHEDRSYRDELVKWLKQLEDSGKVLKIWDDQEIRAGELWEERILSAITEATAAVLIVSQDFFFSEYVKQEELPRLLDKARREELKLLWFAARSSSWSDSPLGGLQALRSPASPLALLSPPEQDEAYRRIYDAIKRALAVP